MSKGFNLLGAWMRKKGIEKEEDLSAEERSTYDGYRRILTGETVTIETLKTFMHSQVSAIESKFGEKDSTHDTYYKACLHIYLTLLRTIEAPEQQREALERHLTQLIEAQ
jgi:hypothetical protein